MKSRASTRRAKTDHLERHNVELSNTLRVIKKDVQDTQERIKLAKSKEEDLYGKMDLNIIRINMMSAKVERQGKEIRDMKKSIDWLQTNTYTILDTLKNITTTNESLSFFLVKTMDYQDKIKERQDTLINKSNAPEEQPKKKEEKTNPSKKRQNCNILEDVEAMDWISSQVEEFSIDDLSFPSISPRTLSGFFDDTTMQPIVEGVQYTDPLLIE